MASKDVTAEDMMTLIMAEILRKGVDGDHINSMNYFTSVGIKHIVTDVFKVDGRIPNTRDADEEDRSISEIQFSIEFTDVKLMQPTKTAPRTGRPEQLHPADAIENGSTYSSEMHIDGIIRAVAYLTNGSQKERVQEIKDLRLADIPTMYRSALCTSSNMTRQERKMLKEDPNDPGGYFIINGARWTINNLENISNNAFHVYKNNWGKEIARGQFISKPGDEFENSYIMILRYMQDQSITAEITVEGKEKLLLPFYIVFRLLGITRDIDIVNHIVYGVDYEDPLRLKDIIEKAFAVDYPKYKDLREETSREVLIERISDLISSNVENLAAIKKDENARRYKAGGLMALMDKKVFPHIGDNENSRIQKARFFGHLVNKLLHVALGSTESTDRDSYKNKRVASCGISEAKTFKTVFNLAIVLPMRKAFAQEFKATPFSKVDLENTARKFLRIDELQKQLVAAITAGNKAKIKINKNEVVSRVSSGMLYAKNDLNIISTLNTIDTPTTASKSTDRADEMRRVHPTFHGYVDVSQSADTGEKVGMNKQLACMASITGSSSSAVVKRLLLADPDIIKLDDVLPEAITAERLAKVFVNGYWIGCCRAAHELARKYRAIRRQPDSQLDAFTSIVWELSTREIYFWTDYGRLSRPLIIVYNNLAEYDDACRAGKPIAFKQYIKLTKQHIADLRRKKITMDDLRRDGIIEYISPDEQENCYLAMNIDVLRTHAADPLHAFTHCDIEQAIFGLVALASPMANHSNGTRITYYTNHRKQSINWFALNWPYRIDKHTAFQYYANRPLVRTFTDGLTNPNGQNTIVALAMYSGDNAEDSIIVNESSVKNGLFNVATFNYEKTDIERTEEVGSIDRLKTKNLKRDVTYNGVKDGLIQPGTPLTRGSVMVVKTQKLSKPEQNFERIDKSLVYKKEEVAHVMGPVIITKSTDDIKTAKVRWVTHRPLTVGDKLSSRSGNKGIVARLIPRHDMPYTEDGLIPDLIVNGHSIPTRMALNQILESAMGLNCALEGTSVDATCFRAIDLDQIVKDLEAKGVKYGGHQRMFNGYTGEWMDCLIFIGPTTYQRLAKFVVDEYYAIERGAIQPMTHQPMDGKTKDGGLRMGEMEKDVYCAHGISHGLWEKFSKDSDGVNIYICRNCGNRATVNVHKNYAMCRHCNAAADICAVPSTWTASLFMNEVAGMGVKFLFDLEPATFMQSTEVKQ